MVKAAGSLMDLDERISLTGGLLSASSTERRGIITELVVTQYQVELIKNFYLYILHKSHLVSMKVLPFLSIFQLYILEFNIFYLFVY